MTSTSFFVEQYLGLLVIRRLVSYSAPRAAPSLLSCKNTVPIQAPHVSKSRGNRSPYADLPGNVKVDARAVGF